MRKAAGFDQAALGDAAKQGFVEGAFEESEVGSAVVEEFFPDEMEGAADGSVIGPQGGRGLADKLGAKAAQLKKAGESPP